MNTLDCRQLRHWNLSENALPEGSIVINKELTLRDFRYYIIGALAFIMTQSLLIAGLLFHRRRRRSAEGSFSQTTEELDQFFNIFRALLCIANPDGYFLRLNPPWEKVLGYSRQELMAKRFLDFVHPDDLVRTQDVVSTLASQHKVVYFENRYRAKDDSGNRPAQTWLLLLLLQETGGMVEAGHGHPPATGEKMASSSPSFKGVSSRPWRYR